MRILDMDREERSPGSGLPASVRRIRGIGRARPPASVISFDEMWTCLNARSGENRNSVFIWTAIVEEADGTRWADYEVGDRDVETFMRLYRDSRPRRCTGPTTTRYTPPVCRRSDTSRARAER